MRCIEIEQRLENCMGDRRLIETWDVLKLCVVVCSQRLETGLIETWDVLKFTCACKTGFNWLRLIETWDVLKWQPDAVLYKGQND